MVACRLSRRLLPPWPIHNRTANPSASMLPFLYETHTIRSASTASVARSRPTARHSGKGHIPFENVQEALAPQSRTPTPQKDGSSLSATEREAFTSLFGRLGQASTKRDDTPGKGGKRRQLGDSTDGALRWSTQQRDAHLARLPSSIRSVAEAALERITDTPAAPPVVDDEHTVSSSGGEGDADAELEAYLDGIEALLNAQSSDIAAWGVLQRELFEPLQLMDLDGTQQQRGERRSKGNGSTKPGKAASAAAAPEMVLAAVPHVALLAAEHIHGRYPRSELPLSILPHLKRISRMAHALALSPDLYASLMSIEWSRSASPSSIVATLQEMEAEGVELDREVLASLSQIVEEGRAMRRGRHGESVQLVAGMEGWGDKMSELGKVWIPLVRQRIIDAAVREAHEREEQLARHSDVAQPGAEEHAAAAAQADAQARSHEGHPVTGDVSEQDLSGHPEIPDVAATGVAGRSG